VRLEHQWRSFFPDGNRIDLFESLDDMETKNPSLNQQDLEDFKKMLSYSKQLYETIEKGYFDKGLDTKEEIGKFHGVVSTFKNFDLLSTVHQGVSKRIRNK